MSFHINQFTIAYLEFALMCGLILFFQLKTEKSKLTNRVISLLFAIGTFQNLVQLLDFSVGGSGLIRQMISPLNAINIVVLMSVIGCFGYCFPSLASENIRNFKRVVMLLGGIAGISAIVIIVMALQGIEHWHFANVVLVLQAVVVLAIGIRHPLLRPQSTLPDVSQPQVEDVRQSRITRPAMFLVIMPITVIGALTVLSEHMDWLPGQSVWDRYVLTQSIWVVIRAYLFIVGIIAFSRYAPHGMRFLYKLIIVFAIGLMFVINGLALFMGRQLTLEFHEYQAQAIAADALDIAFNGQTLQQYLHDHLWPIALVAVFANIGLIIVGQIFFRTALLKPLNTLVEGIERVRAGDLNVRVPIHSGDEIGMMAGAFNEMIASVDSSQAALRLANANLEARVAERTQDLEEALVSAEKANRAKTLFLAKMSHEFRTPLNAIMGFAQLLEQEHPETRHPTTIYNNGHHLLSLVANVLDVAQGEVNQLKLSPEVVDLPLTMQAIVQTMAYRAQRKTIDIHYHASDLPTFVIADAMRLRQILINLLDNAIKFTDDGAVTLNVECHERTTHNATFRFSVSDSGIGIAPEQLEQIFKPFQQTIDGEGFKEGAGLGLAISQQLVSLMGGKIQVESKPDEGSQFWFLIKLPLKGQALSHSETVHFEHTANATDGMKLPSDAIFAQIRASAQIGDVTDIERQLSVLVDQDDKYGPFAEEIAIFTRDFQMHSLRQWLDSLMPTLDESPIQ